MAKLRPVPHGVPNVAERPQRTRKPELSWSSIDAEDLKSFLVTVTEDGAAVMFGRTTRNDALSVLVLSGNDKYREYLNDPKDWATVTDDILWDMDLLLPDDGSKGGNPSPGRA